VILILRRVIAVDTPNDNALRSAWGGYRTSVDKIEAETGQDVINSTLALL
jgi:endonuclease G